MPRRKKDDKFDWNGPQYEPRDFGEEDLVERHDLQIMDAKDYFFAYIKPRADLSHKIYSSYTGDRAREIESWRSNVFVPYVYGTTETLLPRILDARPDFQARGRTQEDQDRAGGVQMLNDYTWEKAMMDDVSETLVRASMEFGISWLKTYWKKDVRKGQFLAKGQDPGARKPKYVSRDVVLYDAPCAEPVDVYSLLYDWRNIPAESKQFFAHRLILSGEEIRRRYPGADPTRLNMALRSTNNDLTEWGHVRYDVKSNHSRAVRNADRRNRNTVTFPDYGVLSAASVASLGRYQSQMDPNLRFHEVFEKTEPFKDSFSVWINRVPVLEGGERPIPFDHKEAPFIDLAYFRYPFEYEGVGLPLLLESTQMSLNHAKNQRLDNSLMAMHKMFLINPLSGVKQEQLAVRPFGLIYTQDPNGVKPIEFSDIKESAFREEDLLKKDMRFASGVDDFSMGSGGDAGSATEVRHLRESTLERVRLFINHLGSTYSRLMRHWMCMYAQFMSEPMVIRVTGEDGNFKFPLIERDDITGNFDFVATVTPSIAGQDEVVKKQGMDLFQLLSQLPFVDLKKLTAKVLFPWKWTISSISKPEQPDMEGMPGAAQPGIPGQEAMGGQPPDQGPDSSSLDAMLNGQPPASGGPLSAEAMQNALALMTSGGMGGGGAGGQAPFSPSGGLPPSPFAAASRPINIGSGMPPTAAGIGGGGFNRPMGGKVNTALPSPQGPKDAASHLMTKASDVRGARKK